MWTKSYFLKTFIYYIGIYSIYIITPIQILIKTENIAVSLWELIV